MKKIYSVVTAVFLCSNFNAQLYPKAGFEDFFLSPESYYNGSDGKGDVQVGFLKFSNLYLDDPQYPSWTGFSVSNRTDNTTAGYGNQYSAYTGSGRKSTNYAVYYSSGSISTGSYKIPEAIVIDSLWITNTTYTAISMRDGDSFSKKFGSPNGADGEIDGTNGEDSLILWVIGESFDGKSKDSVQVVLADYRFTDNSLDYILDEWSKVDLSSFSFGVAQVHFRMESSDNSSWGMNTPAYFAIDDVAYSITLGLDENELEMSVYPNPFMDVLNINGSFDHLQILDMSGRTVFTKSENLTSLDLSFLQSGIYVLVAEKNGNTSSKRIEKR
jgi:hypothetical protein